jgi:hypothetical protein
MSEADDLRRRIAALNLALERLAEQGDWPAVGSLLRDRDALLGRLDAAAYEATLEEARRSTERLLTLARAAQAACRAEILSLRQGRRATGSYVTIRRDSA